MTRRLLEGKTVIVTGTAKGIGKKMVEQFAANGASVFALARSMTSKHKDFCKELEKHSGMNIIPIYFDMTDYDAMKEAVKEIRFYRRTIDGLVNNAGILPIGTLMQMTPFNVLRDTMETNFFAPYTFSKYIIKLMLRNHKGSIVNIASIAGIDASEGDSSYGASKAALVNMTKCIAKEMGGFGIRANAVCPGLTETDMIATMRKENYEVEREATPLNKFAQPEDIANVATFLLSDLSSYITGQTIRVDGGVTSRVKRFNARMIK